MTVFLALLIFLGTLAITRSSQINTSHYFTFVFFILTFIILLSWGFSPCLKGNKLDKLTKDIQERYKELMEK